MKSFFLKAIKFVLIAQFISLFATNLKAQGWGTIDSLKLIPDSPTETSTVQVACFATFGSGDCFIVDTSITISGNVITVQAYHMIGMLTFICNSEDTITLGSNFPSGNYTVIYNLNDSGIVALNTDTLFFSIPVTEGISTVHLTSKINCWPNPAGNELVVQLPDDFGSGLILISDLTGRVLKTFRQKTRLEKYDISSLAIGFYSVRIELFDGSIEVKKICKGF